MSELGLLLAILAGLAVVMAVEAYLGLLAGARGRPPARPPAGPAPSGINPNERDNWHPETNRHPR